MANPWLRKNPFMSMWLSAANKSAGAARGKAAAAAKRQAASVQADAMRQILDFWTPQAATPRPRRQGTTPKPRSEAPARAKASRGGTAAVAGALAANHRTARTLLAAVLRQGEPPPGAGQWLSGVALGTGGLRRWWLYRPPGAAFGERLPLMVMLHGCRQNANLFATSTGMNAIAARERFLVLYPEQDRAANAQACWNWFDTSSGRAHGEAASILRAIDQVCVLYSADRDRIAVAGLSAGASMAAVLALRQPQRFKAVIMHSGIPPGTAHSTLSAVSAMHGGRTTRPLRTTLAAPGASLPPLLVIHGAGDTVVAPSNGRAAANAWAEAAGAAGGAQRTVQRGKRHAAQVTDFKRRGSTAATLVEVAALGHAWSGGAAGAAYSDVQGPDASRMAWRFAQRQFQRRPAAVEPGRHP